MLEKTIGELLKQHISIYEEMEHIGMCKAHFARQLDFLEFWVAPESMKKYSPWKDFNGNIVPPRDNPNLEPTEYENVFRMVKLESIDYIYVSEGRAPVSILQWYKVKNQHREGWKITVYGKGLRLYFNGLLPRLSDYVERYQWETIRADLCRDRQGEKIPAGVIDLKCQKTVPDDTNRTWKYFGNGDLTARIYDKSLDLRDAKGIHYWLYPDWYQRDTWRVEFVFKGKYAKSLSPMQWLSQCPTDGKIKPLDNKKIDKALKNTRSLIFNVVMVIEDIILSDKEKFECYLYMKELIERKINKFSKNKYKDL